MFRWSKWSRSSTFFLGLMIVLAGLAATSSGGRQAYAAGFSDISNHWAEAAIEWGVSAGVVNGYEDGSFRPEGHVSEPEFLAMMVRAFPEAGESRETRPEEAWYAGYYELAAMLNWPVQLKPEAISGEAGGAGVVNGAGSYNRGAVARLTAATQGQLFTVDGSIRYLLEHGLAQGKTSATLEGYAAADQLTRGEAVQFLLNLKNSGLTVQAASLLPEAVNGEIQVKGISIGDSEAYVLAKLGQPERKDLSKYGFDWYVYSGDWLEYAQIGIHEGRVAGFFTSGSEWKAPAEMGEATSVRRDATASEYLYGGAYVKFYYDKHDDNRTSGVHVVTEQQQNSHSQQAIASSASSDRLQASYERTIFDLANAARAMRGLKPFQWNEEVANVARDHSEDMADNGYFGHTNQLGLQPWDRAGQQGLSFRLYAENIAAGQPDPFDAHYAWLNSTTGHRENLLGDAAELGIGVSFGGGMRVYYTQNFCTLN